MDISNHPTSGDKPALGNYRDCSTKLHFKRNSGFLRALDGGYDWAAIVWMNPGFQVFDPKHFFLTESE